MKELNLRDYHPYYMTNKIVEAPDEVLAVLEEFRLSETAFRFRTYGQKVFYSLDTAQPNICTIPVRSYAGRVETNAG